MSKGYALKIAPTLDHVVYATLLYQGQSYGATSPTAIAVDGAGNAYIGGTFDQSPDQLFPAREIGLPLIPPGLGAYVLKLNAEGSALIWCDALASGSVDAVAVLPDGRVLALVAMFPSTNSYGAGLNVEQGEALFRLGTEGAIEKDYFVGGVAFAGFGLNNNGVPRPHGYLAAVPGGDAPLRILIATTSGRIPAIFNDQATRPLLMNLKEPTVEADLSISVEALKPLVLGNGSIEVRITVSNHGPGNADGVQLQAKIGDVNNSTATVIGCFPGGVAICSVGNGALIPALPAGARDGHRVRLSVHVPQRITVRSPGLREGSGAHVRFQPEK